MGRILRAYDPKLEREVALKVVRHDTLGSGMRARLVSEARAMARLSHPNVVSVFDVEAGEDEADSEVRIVMEYVRGTTLRGWLAEEQRTWREVIDAFVLAGRGLSAAHAQGLVHRDFKPSNVLVGIDGPPRIKVNDFGIAKAADDPADSSAVPNREDSDSTPRITRLGHVVGTLRYMAPEQHGGKPLTPAADQFAFCVALWEALIGTAPFSGPTLATDKLKGPPEWSEASAESRPLAGVPKPIAASIRRGLAPFPEDRWPDMDTLLRAITPQERTRKRNLLLGGALTVGVGLATAIWVGGPAEVEQCTGAQAQLDGVWDSQRADRVRAAFDAIDRPYVTSSWKHARATLDAYAERWTTMHRDSCLATARGEQSTTVLDLRMSCLDRARLGLRATVDVLETADDAVVARSHSVLGELPDLERCADIDGLLAGADPPAPEDEAAVQAAQSHIASAFARDKAGRFEAALESVDAAEAAFGDASYVPVAAQLAYVRGAVYTSLGRYEQAVDSLESARSLAAQASLPELLGQALALEILVLGESLKRFEEAERLEPTLHGLAAAHPELAWEFHTNLGRSRMAQARYDEAVLALETALSIARNKAGPESLDVAIAHIYLGGLYEMTGDYGKSETELRKSLPVLRAALGERHPRVGTTLHDLGIAVDNQSRDEEAKALYEEAIDVLREGLPPDHPGTAFALNSLAGVHMELGDLDRAETHLREALESLRGSLGETHPTVASFTNNLGQVLLIRGDADGAERVHNEALDIQLSTIGEEHPRTAGTYLSLANVARTKGEFEESERLHRISLSIRTKTQGPQHPDTALSHREFGNLLLEMGRLDDARTHHELGLEILTQRTVEPGSELAASRGDFARLALALGEDELALELATEAWAYHEESTDADAHRARSAWVYSCALERSGQGAEADSVRTRAQELSDSAGPSWRGALEGVERCPPAQR